MGTAGLQDIGKALQVPRSSHLTLRDQETKAHRIPRWGWSGHPPPEVAVGSSCQVGPFPRRATRNAHVSASGTSGYGRNPGGEEAEGPVGPGQGAPAILHSPRPTGRLYSPQRGARWGWGRRACCAPCVCPSPRSQHTGRSRGRCCTCSGSPPPAHCNHHISHWDVPWYEAHPEHKAGGDPAGTPSFLQGEQNCNVGCYKVSPLSLLRGCQTVS